MNAPIDPKTVEPVQVTTGSLPGSRKVYAEVPGYAGVKVPFREIALSEFERRAAVPRLRYLRAL